MRSLMKNALLVLAVLLIASCKKTDTSSTGTTTGSSSYNPDPIDVTTCASATGMAKIVCLANAFKAQLSTTQIASLQLSYSKANAVKWSNFPAGIYSQRVGLKFNTLTTVQIQYAKALIKAVAGTTTDEGWDELQQLLNADEYLGANGGGSDYGAGSFYIAFLGTPATSGTFEIQYGGHHTAFANTYKDGVLTGATPSFRGVEPFTTFTWNGKSNQPIQQEQTALSAMLNGLSGTEQTTAKLSGTFSDIVAGPQRDGAFPTTASGIKCSTLTTAQKTLVLNAIKTYVGDIDDANAATIITKYTNELDNTYISYSGTTSMTTRNDYARIDGPSVWIEYSCQNGVILPGTHPHSVWRDKTTDYGGN